MKTISIEDQDVQRVLALLVENNVPFQFGATKRVSGPLNSPVPPPRGVAPLRIKPRRKRPRADLEVLLELGALKPGEVLELHDYQGRPIQGCEAAVAGRSLVHNGKHHSMSELAQRLLTREGYKKTAVRGPAHWFTKQGHSIKELWEKHRERSDS